MKRLLLVLYAGLLLNVHVFAQWEDDDYDDYDRPATNASGTEIIINPGTEEASEQRLTLPNSQPINLYFFNNVQAPAPPPQAAPPRPAEPKAEPSLPLPVPLNPPPPLPVPPVEYRFIPSPPVEYWFIPPPPVEYRYIPLPPPEPVYVPPPLPPPPPANIRVIPALPDPNSSRVYRLQVGAYSVHSTAERIAQQLCAAGLQAGIEYHNSLTRVVVQDVRASDAASIVQTLGLMGFQEIWIREK